MICSRSSKSANNKISMFLKLECLIKLLYPIRSNINNTKCAVVGTLCRQKTKQNNAFTKKKTRFSKNALKHKVVLQHVSEQTPQNEDSYYSSIKTTLKVQC